MSGQRPLTELQERKRLLALQADVHRAALRAECAALHARLRWLDEARNKVRSAGPWLAAGAAALGVIAAWRGRKLVEWLPGLLGLWRTIQRLRRG